MRCSRVLVSLVCCLGLALAGTTVVAQQQPATEIASEWQLELQRVPDSDAESSVPIRSRQTWKPQETAIIVCDMWDLHHCLHATRRVAEMAPRMNRVLHEARQAGAIIIHAPSSCVGYYEDHPARENARSTKRSEPLPADIGSWLNEIEAEDLADYPIDQSDGGEDDDPEEHRRWAEELESRGLNPRAPWRRQYDGLTIADQDYISDNGEEIWSILDHRQRSNVILMGVHTNMCVLGRPFGLRQMALNGKNVVLMRDMTDTMYNPRSWPYVSHFQGTDLIVRYIEQYVCATITSDQLIGGEPFRFAGDDRPQATIVVAEKLYQTNESLAKFADQVLIGQLGFTVNTLTPGDDPHRIDGLQAALVNTDLLILSVRRRALPAADLQAIKDYLSAGGSLLALRTSSHAFDTRGNRPEGHAEWPDFDTEVLGGDYTGHHPDGPVAEIVAVTEVKPADLLSGVKLPMKSIGSLYKSSPVADDVDVLLQGSIVGQPSEPVAWTRNYGKAKVFYTSLGHTDDFDEPAFVQLLENASRWLTGMPIGMEPEIKR